MEYKCVQARFLFFNGVKRYTVEFSYGLMTWFVFEEEATTGLAMKNKMMRIHFGNHLAVNMDLCGIVPKEMEATLKIF